MATIEQLEAEVNRLSGLLTQQVTQNMPANERALYLREQELAAERAAIDQAREKLGGEIKQHRATLLSQQTGVPVEKLMEAASVADMTTMALEAVQTTLLNDPAKLRAMADLVERIATGQQTTAPAPVAANADGTPAAPAPGTTPAPAPAVPAAGVTAPAPNAAPATGGAAPLHTPGGEQVTKQYAGKGGQSMAEWLGSYRAATPLAGMSFEAPTNIDPTAPNAAPAPAPAGVPAAAPAPAGAPA